MCVCECVCVCVSVCVCICVCVLGKGELMMEKYSKITHRQLSQENLCSHINILLFGASLSEPQIQEKHLTNSLYL